MGLTVAVIEANTMVGGVIQSESTPSGYLVEWGPNTLQNTGEAIMSLIDELDIPTVPAAECSNKRFIRLKGKLHAVPMSIGSFLMTPLLSVFGKLRLLTEWLVPGSCQTVDEPVSQWATRRLGREVLTNMLAPFLSGVYAGDPSQMSAVSVLKKLAAWEKKYSSITAGSFAFIGSKLFSPKTSASKKRPYALVNFVDGMHALPKGLADALPEKSVVLNERLLAIEPQHTLEHFNENKGEIGYRVVTDHCTRKAKAVLMTVPAWAIADIELPILDEEKVPFADIPYAPMSVVQVAYPTTDFIKPIDGFGVLIPREEGLRTLGCIWTSCLFPNRAPEGMTLLSCFVGGATDTAIRDVASNDIVDGTIQDLQSLLPLKPDAVPVMAGCQKIDRAIPQYTVDHRERVAAIESLNERYKTLHFTGNYLSGVSLNDCVAKGNESAQWLFEALEQQALLDEPTVRQAVLKDLFEVNAV
jgi:oxygen-dependent protoporphyrinogen oxidase